MKLSTVLLFLLYGAALVFIIQFMMTKQPATPIIIQEDSPVMYESDAAWWPWGTGTYNYWPYWGGWWAGGGDGGYGLWRRGGPRIHPQPRPRFGGGPHGQLGGRYGPIGTPASGPGGRPGGMGGRGGGMGGHGGGGRH